MSRVRAALTTALVVGCAGAGLLAATSLASGATRVVLATTPAQPGVRGARHRYLLG